MHINYFDKAAGWLAEPHHDDPIIKVTEDP